MDTHETKGQKCCPFCRAVFTCDYELGKECWCSRTLPAVMPMARTEAGCYCPGCLERKVADLLRQNARDKTVEP